MGDDNNGSREDKFLEYICIGLPMEEAALKAGYSQSYSKTSIRLKFNNPNFLSKLAAAVEDFPDQRKILAKQQLKKVSRIDDKILDKALTNDDVLLHTNVSKTVDRIYRLTGLLQDDSKSVALIQVNLNLLQGKQEQVLEPIDIPLIEGGSNSDT